MKKRSVVFISTISVIWAALLIIGISVTLAAKAELLSNRENESVEQMGSIKEKASDDANSIHTVPLLADYRVYNDAKELTDKAKYVFEGRVCEITYEMVDILLNQNAEEHTGFNAPPAVLPHTIYCIQVEHSYKGDLQEGSRTEVMCLGGIIEDTVYTAGEYDVDLEPDKEYLFVCNGADGFRYLWLLNPKQSVFDLAGGGEQTDVITVDSIRKLYE